MTITEALRHGREALQFLGPETAARDSQILLEHACGLSPWELVVGSDRQVPLRAQSRYEKSVTTRAIGVPVQYLIGSTGFFGLELAVEAGVYIPKPETEHLVESALEILGTPQLADMTWGQSTKTALIHEVGTGSGAISIAIARHAPNVSIAASDVSARALEIAAQNSECHGTCGQITFHRGDLQLPLPGQPDMVLANLPYIDIGSCGQLSTEVLSQPRAALLAGEAGLATIRRLLESLRIKPGGHVLLEIGYDQEYSLMRMCKSHPNICYLRTAKDLAGHDRVAVITAG